VDQFTNYTNTGLLYLDNLTPDNYSFKFNHENYTSRIYNVQIGAYAHYNLDAYLSNNTLEVVFTLKDQSSNEFIEGATLSIEKVVNDNWVVIASYKSDLSGRVQFKYKDDTHYRFTASKEGYKDKVFELNPVIFPEYNVLMEKSTTVQQTNDYDGVNVVYFPKTFYENQTNNFSIVFSSTEGGLINYGVQIDTPDNSYSTTGSNSQGGSLNIPFNISSPVEFSDKVYITYNYTTSQGVTKTFSASYPIVVDISDGNTFMSNANKTYGMGLFERALIITIICVLIGGAVGMFAGAPTGLSLVLLILGYFSYIEFVPFLLIGLPMISMVAWLLWSSSR